MNEELFARHGQLISKRWPTLWPRLLAQDVTHLQVELTEGLGSTLSVDGIQLTSRHDRVKEAKLQAASLPELGDASEAALPYARERALGEETMKSLRSAGAALDDPEIDSDVAYDIAMRFAERELNLGPTTTRD